MLLSKTLLTICSVWLLVFCYRLDALIVPQELVSLLSLIYSNLPVTKKGTDSRLGLGFRLGEHADFQVLLELGPQQETRPIGNQNEESSFNKRHINKADQNALLRQQIRQQLQRQQEQQDQALSSTERNAANWLENWSQDMNTHKKKTSKTKPKTQNTKEQLDKLSYSIPTLPVLSSQALHQLQLLYKMASTTTSPSNEDSSSVTTELTTSSDLASSAERLKKKAQITKELMDVNLE